MFAVFSCLQVLFIPVVVLVIVLYAGGIIKEK